MELGYAHPDILLEELTSAQLTEWMAYDRLEPIGNRRHDYRTAYLCMFIESMVKGIFGAKDQGQQSTIDDYLIPWDAEPDEEEPEEVKEHTAEEMAWYFKMLARQQEIREKKRRR